MGSENGPLSTRRSEDECYKILDAMGYHVTVYDQDVYPVELIHHRYKVGGRFWNLRDALREACRLELGESVTQEF